MDQEQAEQVYEIEAETPAQNEPVEVDGEQNLAQMIHEQQIADGQDGDYPPLEVGQEEGLQEEDEKPGHSEFQEHM